MPTRYAWWSGAWVELGGAGELSDQYPGALLDDGVTAASSIRASVTATAHATPQTWGSWQEVDASLSADASGVFFMLTAAIGAATTNTSTLLQIGTGAGGAEAAWATLGVGYQTGGGSATPYFVPGLIAAGTRVAVRAQSAVTVQAVTAMYQFLPATKTLDFGAPVTYQADTATSRGLVITAPGSLNTKGAWTELVASTGQELNALSLFPQAAGATVMSGTGVLVDIGIGAAASETVLIPDVHLLGHTGELYLPRSPLTYGVDIPAGSRLSARYARANAGNAVDLILVGA